MNIFNLDKTVVAIRKFFHKFKKYDTPFYKHPRKSLTTFFRYRFRGRFQGRSEDQKCHSIFVQVLVFQFKNHLIRRPRAGSSHVRKNGHLPAHIQ